jgi:hypothetical protein
LKQIGFTAIQISALNWSHRVSNDKDLVRLLLAGKNCNYRETPDLTEPFLPKLAVDRLKWTFERALVQHHTPMGILGDTLIQHRDICGDFDYNKAVFYDVQKFFDHQGVSRGQQHYIMKLPLLPGEQTASMTK